MVSKCPIYMTCHQRVAAHERDFSKEGYCCRNISFIYVLKLVMYLDHFYNTIGKWRIWTHYTNMYLIPIVRWRTVQHYLLRVRGSLQIMEQIDLIGQTSEFARVFGIEFYHVLSRGSQVLFTCTLQSYFYEQIEMFIYWNNIKLLMLWQLCMSYHFYSQSNTW